MTKVRSPLLLATLFAPLSFLACTESDETAAEGGGGETAMGGDSSGSGGTLASGGVGGEGPAEDSCVEYTPEEAGEVINATWAESGETDEYSITVPDEPGGGYVTLTVDTDATGMSPSVVVQAEGDTAGAVVSGSSAGLDDESITTHQFEVAPGMTYNVDVGQFGAADEPYPVDYTMTWTFTGVADCYEPNNDETEAKPIALGESITAYSLAGFLTNGFSNPSLVDWYSVELTEEAVLEVEMSQTPGDDRMSIRIFNSDGTRQVGGGGNTMGETFVSTTDDPVEAGTYLIAVETADAASRISTKGDPLPTAWSTPYVIEATAR